MFDFLTVGMSLSDLDVNKSNLLALYGNHKTFRHWPPNSYAPMPMKHLAKYKNFGAENIPASYRSQTQQLKAYSPKFLYLGPGIECCLPNKLC